jgi:hypothetical protein
MVRSPRSIEDYDALFNPALRTALDEIDFWEKVSRSTDFKHS